MRALAAAVLLPVLLLTIAHLAPVAARTARDSDDGRAIASVELAQLPPAACATLGAVLKGGPFPYPQDGVTFANRELRLPAQKHGYYTEYTVRTPGSRDRGARRIIAGRGTAGDARRSGEYWYSDDHYRSFRRIKMPSGSPARLECLGGSG